MREIYLDNSATTRVCPEAAQKAVEVMTQCYGNPSSLHRLGFRAEQELNAARKAVAGALSALPEEIVFTSGGTEADNWAITEAARLGALKGKKHLITSAFEHHAVLHTMQKLEKQGYEVTYLKVHKDGLIRPEEVAAAIREDTALVSIMYANNEIGTIQPIRAIGEICRERGVLFHTDAVQAVGHLPVNVREDLVDLLSFSGHKFHGPKGIGGLYVRKGIPIRNFMEGGAQEFRKRGGTENMPGILGMAAALEEACSHMAEDSARVARMRDRLIEAIGKLPKTRLNGHPSRRVPGNVSFCFEGIEGESLLLRLDLQGICASSGSACTSGSLEPSHVLLAIGVPKEIAHGSLRLSLDASNTEEEVDYIIEKLPGIVETLRDMSPVWEEMKA